MSSASGVSCIEDFTRGIEECFIEQSPAAPFSYVTQSFQTDVLCISLVLNSLSRHPVGLFLPQVVLQENMLH